MLQEEYGKMPNLSYNQCYFENCCTLSFKTYFVMLLLFCKTHNVFATIKPYFTVFMRALDIMTDYKISFHFIITGCFTSFKFSKNLQSERMVQHPVI